MMRLEIYDIEPFQNFFNLIYDSATSIEMKLDQEKLSMTLLNNSHICFYSIEYDRAFFGDYEVDNVEHVIIDVEDFYKILKSANKKDTLTLESDDNYLTCIFEHDANRRVFELPLIDEMNENPLPPSIEYNGEFMVSLNDLKQPCVDLDKIVKTDKFKMRTGDYILKIISPSDSMTKYMQQIDIDSDIEATGIVNLNYILELQKLSKISGNVLLKIDDNKPVSWSMESADGLIKASGLIAPVIEED